MARVDGEWDVVINTPMGAQPALLTLRSDGTRFSGTAVGEIGSVDIAGGTVEGDQARWSMRISKPFPMTLTARVTITDDRVEGSVDAGMMGLMPIAGVRRA